MACVNVLVASLSYVPICDKGTGLYNKKKRIWLKMEHVH